MACLDRLPFGGRRGASKHFVAMRESTEPGNHPVMVSRKSEDERIAESGEPAQRQVLVGYVLAVHQRHQHELCLVQRKRPIPAPCQKSAHDSPRQRIAGESPSFAPEQVARHLIEQQDRRAGGARVGQEALWSLVGQGF